MTRRASVAHVLAALVALGCGESQLVEEVAPSAGLLDSLVMRATVGAHPTCRVADARVGQPARERTRVCTYQTATQMQLWLPPESMAQPMLTFRTNPMPDTSFAVATRDSFLTSLHPDGRKVKLQNCPQAPRRRPVHAATRATTLGADILFLIVQQPAGYNLHVRAWPAGSRRLPCGNDRVGGRLEP